MSQIKFEVIGIDDITTDPSERFISCTTDGNSLYVGSQNLNNKGHIWKYNSKKWYRITDNLVSQNYKGISTLAYNNGTLYAGTQNSFLEFSAGTIWSNNGAGWTNTGFQGNYGFNSAIRKLLFTSNNELYTGGSYYYIWKRVNDVWTASYNSTTNYTHITDLDTDGYNIYASVNKILRSSNVLKYNGTTWSEIATDKFGDVGNLISTKLKWFQDALYVSTFNDRTGTEIWRYKDSQWSQINNDGFGSMKNYTVVSMEIIDSKLVVVTENITGPQVWSFDTLNDGGPDSWVLQNINSEVLYQGYLIQKVGSVNYLIGTARKYLLPSPELKVVQSPKDRILKQNHFYPDGSIGGGIPVEGSPGKYLFFGPNSLLSLASIGTLENPVETIISPLTYSEVLETVDPYQPRMYGITKGIRVLDPKPDLTEYDDYNAGGPAYKDPESGMIIVFCHTEQNYRDPVPPDPLVPSGNAPIGDYSIRMAVSFDDGLNFYDAGKILSTTSGSAEGPILGAIYPNAHLHMKDGYFYIWYNMARIARVENPELRYSTQLSVARAPVSSVISAALNKQTTTWYQYASGSFSIPGNSASAVPDDLIKNYILGGNSWMTFTYSRAINKYIAFVTSPIHPIDANLYGVKNEFDTENFAVFSDDGITWSLPERVTVNTSGTLYNSVLASAMSVGESDDQFYYYNVVNQENSAWGNLNWAEVSLGYYTVNVPRTRSIQRNYTISKFGKLSQFDSSLALDYGQLHPIIAVMHYVKEKEKIFEASAYYRYNLSAFSENSNWKNVLQSYANSSTELSGNFPNSFDNYSNFKFGRDIHKLYKIYTNNFNRHRLTQNILDLDGPTIFGHTFGSVLRNSKLLENGSLTNSYPNLIVSSLSNFYEFKNSVGVFSSSAIGSGTYFASTIADVSLGKLEYRNSGILAHIELCQVSGSSPNNLFSIIRVDKSQKSGNRYNSLLHENTLIQQRSSDGFGRLIFDISKYPSTTSEGYDTSTNFLSPEHKFKFSLKTLVASNNGLNLGGRTIGVWIHTKPEDDKVWSFVKDTGWVRHDVSSLDRDTVTSEYSHLFTLPNRTRSLNSDGSGCRAFLNQNNPNAKNDVIASFSESDFTDIEVEFNTENLQIAVPNDYFANISNQVHRVNQKYVIEVFCDPFDDDKFALMYNLNLIDLTLNKWSKPLVGGILNGLTLGDIYCEEFRVDLSREQLYIILKYFNELAGAYSNFGYGSRVASYTSGVYESEGGSRINYTESPSWLGPSKNSSNLITSIILTN